MKQLNFRHFNNNGKKLTLTVIFFQKETKWAPKRANILSLVYHGVFGHFLKFPDYFMISLDYRTLTNMSEDY